MLSRFVMSYTNTYFGFAQALILVLAFLLSPDKPALYCSRTLCSLRRGVCQTVDVAQGHH
jgi:hypothetical protein